MRLRFQNDLPSLESSIEAQTPVHATFHPPEILSL